jgi:hypothetical protein
MHDARIRTNALTIALVAVTAGCDAAAPGAGPDPNPPTVEGTLERTADEQALRGTLTAETGRVEFRVANAGPSILDVQVKVNGAVLTGTVDRDDEVLEMDGFVDGSGAETQLREEDRALLAALHRQLPALASERGEDQMRAEVLEKFVSLWVQSSDTFALPRSAHGEENRGWTSLCSSCNQYLWATHDCSNCGENAANCSSYGMVGSRDATTLTWRNNQWEAYSPDHEPYLYQRGACYGNSGPGCPGPFQQLTVDAHNHDQCVRNGHMTVSGWCDDEFSACVDDELFAADCKTSVERIRANCVTFGTGRGGSSTSCTCAKGYTWDGGFYCHKYGSTCN